MVLTRLVEVAKTKPLLQVALDFNDIVSAVDIAVKVYNGGAPILEVGTPLVKSYGVLAAKIIRGIARDRLVVVDLKTVDAAKLELEPFIKMGVDGITILGLADDSVFEEAVTICEDAGVALIADMIHIDNPLQRALRLADKGVKIVELHVGVDVQKRRGITAIQILKEVEELSRSGILVAVAGGIKPSETRIFAEHGARIIVIGSAITRAHDPEKATKEALKNLTTTT